MIPSIITITLNPAIDLTVTLPQLHTGEVNLAHSSSSQAGGKGVNVASCIADWGLPVLATGFLGEQNHEVFETLFLDKGIANHFIPVPGNTRINIKLADLSNGETTDINLPGLAISQTDWEKLLTRLASVIKPGCLVVLAGSLPSALDTQHYPQLIAQLRQWGAHVLLDSSGPALAAALAASPDALPHCIKPNRHELEQWAGHSLPDLPAILDCARKLQQQGIAQVVVSLGEQGALFLPEQSGPALFASLPVQNPLSTVGAGDALVAGLTVARSLGLEHEASIRLAMAFASAKLARLGPHLPDNKHLQQLADMVALSPC